MQLSVNLFVECYFNNSTKVGGFLKNYNSESVTLIDNDGNQIVILLSHNILFFKQYKSEDTKLNIKPNISNESELIEKFNNEVNKPSSELRNKNIAELKILLNQQEKKIISDRLKDHVIKEPLMPNYSNQFNILKKKE